MQKNLLHFLCLLNKGKSKTMYYSQSFMTCWQLTFRSYRQYVGLAIFNSLIICAFGYGIEMSLLLECSQKGLAYRLWRQKYLGLNPCSIFIVLLLLAGKKNPTHCQSSKKYVKERITTNCATSNSTARYTIFLYVKMFLAVFT